MKISILAHGVMPFARQYAQIFQRRGHEVELFSLTPCEPMDGVPTRVFSNFEPTMGGSRLNYLRCVLPVRRALRQFQPDLIFAMYLTSGGIVAALSGHRRVVASALGSDINLQVDTLGSRTLLRWICRRSVLVHAVSESLGETIHDRLGVPRSKILVSPVGVDTRFLAFTDPEARPRANRIITPRSHDPIYDHPTLLRAMAILKERGVDFHATFTMRESGEVRGLARELGVDDRATFLPGYEFTELPALLGKNDVYVSCSLSDGTSQSLLEAMSTGLFPVVSDIPANRPWVEPGRGGLLFPVGNSVALADRLMEAFADPGLRASAAPTNRQRVMDRGEGDREGDRLLEAFRSCLDP